MTGIPDFQNKEEVRKHFLSLRNGIDEEEYLTKSRKIFERLLGLPEFKSAQVVHSYISMSNRNEVDTMDIIQHCLSNNKKVAVPKMIDQERLKHFELSTLEGLKVNSWGVPEPDSGNVLSDESKIDLIIIPMVAGDLNKNRIGYGKGYYDRFLSSSKAVKTGLLFEIQLSEIKLPIEEFDIPLDILITEDRYIE
jgi:5-formyltetrahydrofolate cyclo-ligase